MAMTSRSDCRRPLVRVLGAAARCAWCGAERGEPCRLLNQQPPRLMWRDNPPAFQETQERET